MEKIKGVHHISLKALGIEQFNKTVDFYTRILGLDIFLKMGQGENQGVMINT